MDPIIQSTSLAFHRQLPLSQEKDPLQATEAVELYSADNLLQNGALICVAIAVVGIAYGLFTGFIFPLYAFIALGSICLVGAYYLRDYTYLLSLREIVPELTAEVDRLNTSLNEFEKTVESLQKSDQLFKERYQNFKQANADFQETNTKLTATQQKLSQTEQALSKTEKRLNKTEKRITDETQKLKTVRSEIEQETQNLHKASTVATNSLKALGDKLLTEESDGSAKLDSKNHKTAKRSKHTRL